MRSWAKKVKHVVKFDKQHKAKCTFRRSGRTCQGLIRPTPNFTAFGQWQHHQQSWASEGVGTLKAAVSSPGAGRRRGWQTGWVNTSVQTQCFFGELMNGLLCKQKTWKTSWNNWASTTCRPACLRPWSRQAGSPQDPVTCSTTRYHAPAQLCLGHVLLSKLCAIVRFKTTIKYFYHEFQERKSLYVQSVCALGIIFQHLSTLTLIGAHSESQGNSGPSPQRNCEQVRRGKRLPWPS